jgi:ML-like domain
MARPRDLPWHAWSGILLLLVSCLSFPPQSSAALDGDYITTSDAQGNKILLEDKRRPALYTQNFGDCQGDSLINVTRFDAAYYRDNMTILFHLAGNTALTNESLMCKYHVDKASGLLLTATNSVHRRLCLRRTPF